MEATLTFDICQTPHGWVGLIVSPRGLRGTTLPLATREQAVVEVTDRGAAGPAGEDELAAVRPLIDALAAGRGDLPIVPIDWDGVSPFRRAVLEETMRIPAGETRSYGWLAAKVGKPGAARAVGRVMATNPVPLVAPCHRVLGSDGGLHGFGGGLAMKERLLRAEGVPIGPVNGYRSD